MSSILCPLHSHIVWYLTRPSKNKCDKTLYNLASWLEFLLFVIGKQNWNWNETILLFNIKLIFLYCFVFKIDIIASKRKWKQTKKKKKYELLPIWMLSYTKIYFKFFEISIAGGFILFLLTNISTWQATVSHIYVLPVSQFILNFEKL